MRVVENNPRKISIREDGAYHYCQDKLNEEVDHFEVIKVWGFGYLMHEEGIYRCYKCGAVVSEELIMALRLGE